MVTVLCFEALPLWNELIAANEAVEETLRTLSQLANDEVPASSAAFYAVNHIACRRKHTSQR